MLKRFLILFIGMMFFLLGAGCSTTLKGAVLDENTAVFVFKNKSMVCVANNAQAPVCRWANQVR